MHCLQFVKYFDISDLFLPHNNSHTPGTEMGQCFSCLNKKLTKTPVLNHMPDVIKLVSGIPRPLDSQKEQGHSLFCIISLHSRSGSCYCQWRAIKVRPGEVGTNSRPSTKAE